MGHGHSLDFEQTPPLALQWVGGSTLFTEWFSGLFGLSGLFGFSLNRGIPAKAAESLGHSTISHWVIESLVVQGSKQTGLMRKCVEALRSFGSLGSLRSLRT